MTLKEYKGVDILSIVFFQTNLLHLLWVLFVYCFRISFKYFCITQPLILENEHCKLLPYRKDSSFYIETTENRTVVRPCPTGTAFDIRSCACTTMTTVRGHSGKLNLHSYLPY